MRLYDQSDVTNGAIINFLYRVYVVCWPPFNCKKWHFKNTRSFHLAVLEVTESCSEIMKVLRAENLRQWYGLWLFLAVLIMHFNLQGQYSINLLIAITIESWIIQLKWTHLSRACVGIRMKYQKKDDSRNSALIETEIISAWSGENFETSRAKK